MKSDLIYRLFLENDNIQKYKEKIKIFKWDGSGENVVEININEFIPEFLIYKQLF
ncbi:hypothetical protein ACT7DG_15245 [Bacillus cereus]